ncbi:MAG: hypothetical protein LQ343_004826 [Gyalolechia ehrenbergii]|nr:MAG: hypothetical protein LQ343_004826 [Gyalolechia ehrenbergii]
MPRPSKRNPPPISTSSTHPAPSALARQHKISASTEQDIQTAFLHFAIPSSPSSPSSPNPESHLLPSNSLKLALLALGIPPLSKRDLTSLLDAADPDDTGSIEYTAFFGVAALKFSSRDEGDKQAEIDEAFALFLGEGNGLRGGGGAGGTGNEEVITIKTLKKVAEVLKEDVDEKVLRDMILEANGGRGVRQGVGKEEFGEVMRRAGVLR